MIISKSDFVVDKLITKGMVSKDKEAVQTVFGEFETFTNVEIKDNKEMSYWKVIASKVVSNAGSLID